MHGGGTIGDPPSISQRKPSPAPLCTRTAAPWLAVLVSIGLARPWTACSTSNAARAIASTSTGPWRAARAPRVATVTAAEDPRPHPRGIIERISSQRGGPFQEPSTARRTYAYFVSWSEAPSTSHSSWSRAYTSVRRSIAVARAGSPKTAACSPKRMSFPGAEALAIPSATGGPILRVRGTDAVMPRFRPSGSYP